MRLQAVAFHHIQPQIPAPPFPSLCRRRRRHGTLVPPPIHVPLPAGAAPQFVALPPNEKRQHTTIANRVTQVCDGRFVVSLSSCNGLLCIGLSDENPDVLNRKSEYYVFNPTTNQRSSPIPQLATGCRYVAIAFDPSKSNHYKLVCVDGYRRVWVFSSESRVRVWRNTGTRLPGWLGLYCSSSPYLNGAIHWYLFKNEFVCLDLDSYELRPMPCISCVNNDPGWCKYFGEYGGHLHFIGRGRDKLLLNVFEMQNDYSQWVFKYQVDVGYMARFCPQLLVDRDMFSIGLLLTTTGGHEEEEEEKEEGLVISLPNGKLIFWRLHDMSITQLVETRYQLQHHNCRDYFASKHIHTLAIIY